jgi:CRP-like cAMP-binding protein
MSGWTTPEPPELPLNSPRFERALFWANRACDILFVVDILLQFNLAYYDPVAVRMQTSRRLIAQRYLSTDATRDVISTIPFDLIAALADHGATDTGQPVLRALRALRLAKLLRLLRSNRIMVRLEDALHVQSGVLRLVRFAVAALLLAHWLACGLHLVAQFEGADCSWVSAVFAVQRGDPPCLGPPPSHDELPTVGSVYLAALMWSTQTATTVGYGDVPAQTNAERAYVVAAMLLGGAFFSYVTGSIVAITASLREREAATSAVMDRVNQFIEVAALPPDIARRARAYFRFQHLALTSLSSWRPLLDTMSPALRGDVAMALHAGWLSRLPLFARAPQSLLIELSFAFRPMSFPPGELLARAGADAMRGSLMIVTRGCVAVRTPYSGRGGVARLRFSGLLVGEEALWPSRRSATTVTSATLVDVQAIRVDALLSLIESFPAFKQHCRRVSVCHWLRERMAAVAAGVRVVHTMVENARVAGVQLSMGMLVAAALAATTASAADEDGGSSDGGDVDASGGRFSAGTEDEEARQRERVSEVKDDASGHAARAADALAFFIVSHAAPDHFAVAEAAVMQLQRVWRGHRTRAALRAAMRAAAASGRGAAAAFMARAERDAALRRTHTLAHADPQQLAIAELVTHDVLMALRPQLASIRLALATQRAAQGGVPVARRNTAPIGNGRGKT